MTQASDAGTVRRPILDPGPLTAPFWEAARRDELAVQQCAGCGTLHHPPVRLCPECHGLNFDFKRTSGQGVVHEFSIMREARVVGFESMVPYAVLVVEIDDQQGLFVIGNLIGTPAQSARVGMRVRVCFVPYGIDDLKLPQFMAVGEEIEG